MITSRPSRSQVEVRLGSFVDGTPRLQTFHWNTLKVAHLRPDMTEASRPKLGRPTTRPSKGPDPTEVAPDQTFKMADESNDATEKNKQICQPAKIQKPVNNKGPVITREMFDKWTPELLGLPNTTESASGRPVRSTRNPKPNYIDAINGHFASIGS